MRIAIPGLVLRFATPRHDFLGETRAYARRDGIQAECRDGVRFVDGLGRLVGYTIHLFDPV